MGKTHWLKTNEMGEKIAQKSLFKDNLTDFDMFTKTLFSEILTNWNRTNRGLPSNEIDFMIF